MLIAPLDNEQTVNYLHSSVSLERFPIRFPHTRVMLDRVLPDMALETSLTMRLGGFYIPIIGVNDFPEETYPAILDALNRERLEYRWVTRFICAGKEEGSALAKKKEKSHRGSRKSFMQTFAESTSNESSGSVSGINHGAGVKEADAAGAQIEIETDEASLGYITTNVMVQDSGLEQAKEKANIVKNIINSAGFTCKEETFNALEAWKSMMPGNVYANIRALPVMSYNMSHVVPLSSIWAGERENSHALRITGCGIPTLICSTREGTPFYFSLTQAGSDVGHAAVFGPTGAGKSTLLGLIEAQFFKYPSSRVIVFDKGRSCRGICLALGGLFYEPAADSPSGVSFQPLADLEGERSLTDAQDFIEACVEVNNYAVTPPLRAAIKESLELLRGKSLEARTLTSFIHYANYLDPQTSRPVLKEMLGDYLWEGGKYGKIFDSRAGGVSRDARFLAFEMEALMARGDGAVVPALVYLFNFVEKMFDGKLTLLVLDEAWLFLKNETFSEKIAEWLKVLRKKNVYVLFATQDVADAANSNLRTTIVQQCLTKIYLADPSARTAAMEEVYSSFGLTENEIDLIAGAVMKRDYFYTNAAGGRRMFTLDLEPLSLSLIGSPDHALLDALEAEYGAGAPLCEQILKERGIDYNELLGRGAPEKDKTAPARPPPRAAPPGALPPVNPEAKASPFRAALIDCAALFDALEAGPRRKNAASSVAKKLGVSEASVFMAKKVLKEATADIIESARNGRMSLKAACKKIKAARVNAADNTA